MSQVDISAMQRAVQQFLDIIEPDVETNSTLSWNPSDGFLPIALRAIVRRQFEGLQSITQSVNSSTECPAVQLLRPACEELIWAKYLVGIERDVAEELIECSARVEVLRSLKAQDRYTGRTVTESVGLLHHLENFEANDAQVLARLRGLGERLGWPKSDIQRCRLPSAFWLAKTTDEQETYGYIYQATSRFVHFSAHELLRRGWGNPQQQTISVDSKHMEHYRAHLSLHFGTLLFVRTMTEALADFLEVPIGETKADEVSEVLKSIGSFGQPLIITPQELNWPIY